MVSSPMICQACNAVISPEQMVARSQGDASCPACGVAVSPAAVTVSRTLEPGLYNTSIGISQDSGSIKVALDASTHAGPNNPPPSHEFPFLAPPRHADELGWLGPYRVLDVLGMGGMGVVFRAEDPQLKRQIALKAMLPAAARSAVDVTRFLREARAQAAVEHDHVAAIHQVGEDRGVPFIAMPLLKGQPLSSALRANPRVPIPEAVRIAREMAEGLAAAHESGLIHRDIKPGNVWLEGKRRRVKILDFGLARLNAGSSLNGEDVTPMTQAGVVVGTPAYMSPEQAKGDPMDARSDLFSLGIVLYQMLAGREPFRAGNVTGLLIAVATEHPPRPALINSLVPPVLDAFTMRLLGKNPDERPATAEEAASQLRFIEAGLGVAAIVAIPVEAVPMGVPVPNTAPDPWDAIDATEMDVEEFQPVSDSANSKWKSESESDGVPPRKPQPWLLIAAILAFVAVTAAAADIIIKIKNKDGTVTEIKAPDGSKVAVNGVDVTPVTPKVTPKKDSPPQGGDTDAIAAKWVLSVGGAVRVNDKEKTIARADELPPEPFKLTYAEIFNNKKLTDADLTHFKDCKHLEGLVLSDCLNVTGAGWAQSRDWKNLRHLHLGHTKITNEALANFKECKNLTFLDLGHTPVGDAGLANFKGCQSITTLLLGHTRVTDEGLVNFKECKDLVSLSIDGTTIGDAGLAHFKDCKKLRMVQLTGTAVSDKSVPLLQTQANLTHLILQRTGVTPEGVAILKKALPNTQILGGGGLKPFDDRLAAQHAIQLGGKVSVNNQPKEIAVVGDLPKEPFQLTILNLRDLKHLTDDDFTPFKGCVTLRVLGLGHSSVSDAALANFKGCDNLVELDLSATNTTDVGFANFKGSKKLSILYLNSTKVSDASMPDLAECKSVTQIWLDNSEVTDAGLLKLKDCKSLTTLNVRTKGVTDAGAMAIALLMPDCKVGRKDGVVNAKPFDDQQAAEFVLSRKGKVWVNNLWEQKDALDSQAKLPKEPFTLTGIDLSSTQASDADMVHFKNCKNLMMLGLTDTKVGDAGLANFKGHTKLSKLHLSGTPVTDEGLAHFQSCKGLVDILLNQTKVSDAGLAHFQDCKDLVQVMLLGTLVTDQGLANLKGCKNLEWLDVSNTRVGDVGVANFKDCSRLTHIHLQVTQVTDAVVPYFQDCKQLVVFDVRKTKVTAAKLKEFAAALPQCKIVSDTGVIGPKPK